MKKIILLAIVVLSSVCLSAQQSSKVVYSNAMTHFYITCYINDTSMVYTISETSVPIDNIWRFADREQTQVLYTFKPDEIKTFLKNVSDFDKTAKINDSMNWKNINVEIKKIMGIRCIVLSNNTSKVQCNTNKRSIDKGLDAIIKYEE